MADRHGRMPMGVGSRGVAYYGHRALGPPATRRIETTMETLFAISAIGAFVALLALFGSVAALFGEDSREPFAPYGAGA